MREKKGDRKKNILKFLITRIRTLVLTHKMRQIH